MQPARYSRTCLVAVVASLVWLAEPSLRAVGPPVPHLTALAEPTIEIGSPSATLHLAGRFTSGDEVTVDGSPVPTTFVNATTLQAELQAGLLAAPATYRVRVRNASGLSNPLDLAVSTPRPAFVVDRTLLPVPTEPAAMALAQLDGDGRPDLVYLGNNTIQIALANTAGGFQPPVSLALAGAATRIEPADLDADGFTDLLVTRGADGLVSTFYSDGQGSLTPGPTLLTGHSSGRATSAADLDGDGTIDILSANQIEGTVDVHLGTGNGGFDRLPSFPSLEQATAPVVHDFDNDGLLDVVLLSPPTGALALHRGNGDGTFAEPSSIPVAAGSSTGVFPADLNGDARLDLILPGSTPFLFPRLQVLLGQGDGTFTPPPPAFQPLTPRLDSLAPADVDGDGALDVVGVWSGGTAYVLRGDRSGNFTLFTQLQLPISARTILSGHLDGNGMPDFVAAGLDTSTFPVQPTLLQILQKEPGPPPLLILPDATFTEGDGASRSVTMPVLLVDESGQPTVSTVPVNITLAFFDGTAVESLDYTASPAPSFDIPEGTSEGQIDFRIVGGVQFEPTETFIVQIASATGAIIQDGTATVTILDNDPPPPMADLSTSFVIADPLDPTQPVTGTVTLTNHGPETAQNPTAAIQLGFFELPNLSNIAVTDSTFFLSNVNGGLIRGQNLTLPPDGDASLTFSATPTAAAQVPRDLAFTTNDPAQLFQLSYAFSTPGAAGRTGVAFAGDGDNRVNDLLLHDPDPNVLRIVHNADQVTTSVRIVDLAALYPDYAVTSMEVCHPLDGASPMAVLALGLGPLGIGDRSVLGRIPLQFDPGGPGNPFVDMDRSNRTIVGTKCVDLDADGDRDVLALDSEANSVLVYRNDGTAGFVRSGETPTPFGMSMDMAVGDFDGDGDVDVAVRGKMGISLLQGDGTGNLASGTITSMATLAADAMTGGLARDPVANVERPIDFNADGFPDLAIACTACAPGGEYGIVPLLNRGANLPGTFSPQAPFALGFPGKKFGSISALGMPLVNETIISLTAKDGYNTMVVNTTPPNASVVTLELKRLIDENTRRFAGSGPSAVVPLNAFDDAEADFLALGLRGRLSFEVSGSAQTADPDPTNNFERRTVGIRPGPPESFDFKVSATWTPNTIGELENLADDPTIDSLNGARVFLRDQLGTTAHAQVLTTSDRSVSFVWPSIPDEFTRAGAEITLFAETAGGTGMSVTRPVVEEEPAGPAISIGDVIGPTEGGPAGSAILRFEVTLSAPSAEPVSVSYATSPGSAEAGVDYLHAAGSIAFAPGETTRTIEVTALADLIDEEDETFSVILSGATGATLADGVAVGTIVDDDEPPQVELANLSATEGDTGTKRVTVTATLVGPSGAADDGQPTTSGKTVRLDVSASDGSATAGVDYAFQPRMLILAPGEGSTTFDVDIVGDTTFEPDESFHFDIVAINVTTPAETTFVVENDDSPPAVSIDDVTVREDNLVPTSHGFKATLRLSKPSDTPVTVVVVSANGTAFGGEDYQLAIPAVTFAPGETVQETTVLLIDDQLVEGDETFTLRLLDVEGATIADGEALVTIVDNDVPSDTVPPTVTPPADVVTDATDASGATVSYPPPVVSDNQPGASVTCVPPSGSVFPIGTTTVTCTARDAAGNLAAATFDVTVRPNRPRIAARVVGQGVAAPGSPLHFFDVEFRNGGSSEARDVTVVAITPRPFGGTGGVSRHSFTTYPLEFGDIDPGAAVVRRIYLYVAQYVTGVTISMTGKMDDASGASFGFGAGVAAPITVR